MLDEEQDAKSRLSLYGAAAPLDDLRDMLQVGMSQSLPDAGPTLRVFGDGCGQTRQLVNLPRGNIAEVAGAPADAPPVEYAHLAKAMRQGILILLLLVSAALQPVSATGRVSSPEVGSPGGTLPAPLACDPDGVQASGAVYRICMSSIIPWNGDLFVYAHGYVSPTEPIRIPEDQMILPGGLSIADIVNVGLENALMPRRSTLNREERRPSAAQAHAPRA